MKIQRKLPFTIALGCVLSSQPLFAQDSERKKPVRDAIKERLENRRSGSTAASDVIVETKQAAKKSGRGLEGTVKTRIGNLKFDLGFPTDETVEELYDEMDFQRACQAYLWGLPMVEMAEWQKAQKDVFKAGPNDFVTYQTATEKLGILTANATTPYMMNFPNLKETGPMVFEIPSRPDGWRPSRFLAASVFRSRSNGAG